MSANSHALQASATSAIPRYSKGDKLPRFSQWSHHLWILLHSLLPLALHQAWLSCSGRQSFGRLAVLGLYLTAYAFAFVRMICLVRSLVSVYGYFDGQVHDRHRASSIGLGWVSLSLAKSVSLRMAMAVYVCYDGSQSPADALCTWQWWLWLALETSVYAIVLDFWYYWYHRAMHSVPFLWKYHRTHHAIKHPTFLLTAHADLEQQLFDAAIIPWLTCATLAAIGLRLGFYEWWICNQYATYTETLGHSGLRIHFTPPMAVGFVIEACRAEIVIEDHDLHHRRGWRKSFNYGKQTRIWDRVFGTCAERIESVEANLDDEVHRHMPIFSCEM
ncbi:hypothetical protein CDD81_7584 [Ophiocordyceps australis]|uniref:Fatty acid hydroxylase domain-containing protein n=1 Tax=Ophiocordyceps australis TaxID=1399860 RepID=A0A2C5Y5D2_9HYPO|nr:hypothetical protein CDD81_7584 [Ophiocordyceps australis]